MVEPGEAESIPTAGESAPTPPAFDDTLPGCTSMLFVTEITAWPFLLGFLGCGYTGYWFGADRFPGTGAAYALAILGGLVGIFAGFAVVGATAGAILGGGIGWCLWSAVQWLTDASYDSLFWWPVYLVAGIGGLIGFWVAVNAALQTVPWWRHLQARRKATERGA